MKFPNRQQYKNIVYTDEIRDLILALLNTNPKKRLGAKNDFEEILEHPAFDAIDIESLKKKEFSAPFKPDVTNYLSNFDCSDDVKNTTIVREPAKQGKKKPAKNLFGNLQGKKK